MADEYIIGVKITADVSGLDTNLKSAVSSAKANLDQLQAAYLETVKVIKDANADLAATNAQFAGSTEAVKKAVAAAPTAAIEKATQEQKQLVAQLDQTGPAAEAAADGYKLTEKQLKLTAAAVSLAAQQLEVMQSIAEETAGLVSASSTDMEVQYKKALTEMSVSSALFAQTQRQLGFAAAQGSEAAQAAIEASSQSYRDHLLLLREVAAQKAAITRAEAASAEATAAAAQPVAALGEANAFAARSGQNLAAIQNEVTEATTATSAEIHGNYIRARVEAKAADDAYARSQRELGTAAAQGNAEAAAALEVYNRARLNANSILTEIAAKEELVARAQDQSTAATIAAARANVEATIAKEGSAVAALALADAETQTVGAVDKQATAAQRAADVVGRSQTVMAALTRESNSQAGASISNLQAIIRSLQFEIANTTSAARAAWLALGQAFAEGNQVAATSIGGLDVALAAQNDLLDTFKAKLDALSGTPIIPPEAPEEINSVTRAEKLAAEQAQNLASIEKELAASVGQSAAELGTIYVRAADAARAATRNLVNESKNLRPAIEQGVAGADTALQNLRAQQIQAGNAAAESAAKQRLLALAEEGTTPATATAARAQAELAIQEHGSAVAALEVAEASRKAAVAEENLAESSATARLALGEAAGTTQGMFFALSRIASQSAILKPIIANLFPAIIGIAFVEILGQALGKISDVIDALAGMDAAAKKAYEDIVAGNQKSIDSYLQLAREIDKIKEVGLSGPAKLGQEAANATSDVARLNKEINENRTAVEKLQEAVDNTGTIFGKAFGVHEQSLQDYINAAQGKSFTPDTTAKNRDEAEQRLADLKKHGEELTDELRKINEVARPQNVAEQGAEAFRRSIENRQHDLESTKSYLSARAEAWKKAAQDQFTDGQLSYQQLYDAEKAAEQERFDAAKAFVEGYNQIQAARRTKGEYAPDKDIRAEEQEHQGRLDDIERTRARNHNAELRRISEEHVKDVQEIAATAAAEAPEGHSKRAELETLKAQAAEIEVLRAQSLELDKRYAAAYAEIQKRIPVVTKEANKETETETKKDLDEQYEIWVGSQDRTLQEIILFWARATAEYSDNAEIAKEALAKVSEAHRKLREEQLKVAQEEEKGQQISQTGALEEQKIAVQRKYTVQPIGPISDLSSLNPFSLSSAQKEQQEIGQIDLQEIAAKHARITKQLEDEALANRTTTDQYKKLQNDQLQLEIQFNNKSKQLEQQALAERLNNYRQFVQQLDQAFLNGLNQWILGNKKFSTAMLDAWKGIVTSITQDIEKIAAKWIEEHIIMAAITKVLGVSASASLGAAAQHNATNVAMATSDANAAAAGALRSVFEAVPFPVNVAIAPPIVASVLATGLGFAAAASAETGGYIPKGGLVNLHPGEVVVNHPVTQFLGDLAARSNAYGDGPRSVVPNASPDLFRAPSAASGVPSGASSSVGPTHNHVHLNYSPTINGTGGSPSDMKAMLDDHAAHIMQLVNKQAKTFNR